MDAHRGRDNRACDGGARRRADLLRGEHRQAGAARARPGRDRPRARDAAVRERGAGARQLLARRLGGAGARAPGRRRDDRAARSDAARARTTRSCCAGARGPLRAAAERGLRAAPGRDARALAGARRSTRGPRSRARGCCAPTDARSRARGASRRRRRRSPARARAAAPAGRAEPRRARRARWTGASPRRCSCAARRPPQVDYLDPDFFVYSDEVDFARRLRDAGWVSLYVPGARRDAPRAALQRRRARRARIVELSRNRDLYMRKHHSALAALARCAG